MRRDETRTGTKMRQKEMRQKRQDEKIVKEKA